MTSDAVGGVWNYTLELAGYLAEHEIDVQVCVLGPSPSPAQTEAAFRMGVSSVEISGLPLEWTATSEAQIDGTAQELQDRALQWHADVVHLNAPAQAGTANWPIPLVVSVHSCVGTWWEAAGQGKMPPDLAWRARRASSALILADEIVVPSHSFARELAVVYGEPIPLTVIHNGRRQRVRQLTGLPRDVVITAGRLWDEGKNLRVIGRAAAIWGGTIYAAGPKRGPNGEQADLSWLRLLGTLAPQELDSWYSRASIFVSMSLYEPFGLAVLEAAQAGAALVLSDIPTFRELWDGAAVFVDPDDADALADALMLLGRSPAELRKVAAAAEMRAHDYTVAKMGAGTLEVYRRALRTRESLPASEGVTA